MAAIIWALSRPSPEQVTEFFVTSSTVTPGNFAKAALILPPQPPGHLIPVTLKLTVEAVSCVSVAGSVAAPSPAAALVVLLSPPGLGAGLDCEQPIASSMQSAAKCFSFIGPLSKNIDALPPTAGGLVIKV